MWEVCALWAFKAFTLRADTTWVMQSKARHDLRHPIATMFLIGSTAHAFGNEFGDDMLARCREEMIAELKRFRALVHRHRVAVDVSELVRSVTAFSRDPGSPGRGQAVQEACRGVLGQLGLGGPSGAGGVGPIEIQVDGLHALEA